jgi:hypothetical protein
MKFRDRIRRLICGFFGHSDIRIFLVPGETQKYSCVCRSCGEFWREVIL